jgi:hypothetical protein
MMVRAMNPANGTVSDRGAEGDVFNPLARLIQIVRQNGDLLRRLEAQGRRLSRAREYRGDPASNSALGEALVGHARKGFVNLLSLLRENRAEALGILRACGHADIPEAIAPVTQN